MKKVSNFIKEDFKKEVDKINEILTGKNILLILLVYVIGTVIVMYRNFNEGIPFSTYSIVNYAILTFYLIIFGGVSWFEEWIIGELLKNEYEGGKIKKCIKKFGSFGLMIFIISIVMTIIMNMFLYEAELNKIIAYVIILYVILPMLGNSNIHRNIGKFSVLMSMLTSALLITDIPASIGGLQPIDVKFYNYQNDIIHDYLYYGEANGNYIFKEGQNKIILRSIDSGYIEYYKNETELEEKKMKYKVEIKETLSRVIEIEATNEDEALSKIKEQYNNEEIILDSNDYIETKFSIYK